MQIKLDPEDIEPRLDGVRFEHLGGANLVGDRPAFLRHQNRRLAVHPLRSQGVAGAAPVVINPDQPAGRIDAGIEMTQCKRVVDQPIPNCRRC